MKKQFVIVLIMLVILSACAFAQAIRIYTEDSPPLQTKQSDGSLGGYAVNLVVELQRRVGNSDEIHMVPWARGYDELKSRENVVLFSTARTAERNELFHWVGPIFEKAYVFYSRKDSNVRISDLESARKYVIGTEPNDVRDQFLSSRNFQKIDHSPDYTTAFKKLLQGRIDAVAGNFSDSPTEVIEAGGKADDVVANYVFLKTQLWIVFSKATQSAIVTRWGEAFESMRRDGTFESLFRKAFPTLPLPGKAIVSF